MQGLYYAACGHGNNILGHSEQNGIGMWEKLDMPWTKHFLNKTYTLFQNGKI